jgi:hypothetical protein
VVAMRCERACQCPMPTRIWHVALHLAPSGLASTARLHNGGAARHKRSGVERPHCGMRWDMIAQGGRRIGRHCCGARTRATAQRHDGNHSGDANKCATEEICGKMAPKGGPSWR